MDCVDIKVGFSCNNSCLHCVTADKQRFGDLTTERIKEEIAYYRDHLEAVLVITGGEPTIRLKLPELIHYGRQVGFRRIELQTNGRALSNPKLAEILAKAGLTSALVALHGSTAQVHNSITQRPGAFEQTTTGMRNLINNGVSVRTNTVISRLNLTDLGGMAPFLAAQYPEIRLGQLTFPHPNGNAYSNFDRVIPQLTETARIVVQTLHSGLRSEIWFLVEAIPPCLLPGFEKHCIDLRPMHVAGSDFGSGTPGGRVANYRQALQAEKRKGEQCNRCSLAAVCEGVWKEYAAKFGTKELLPVTNLDPDFLQASYA